MIGYGPAQLGSDSEMLQADVMRFMAIIAFCLIAILALVREIAPADPTPEPKPIPPAPRVETVAAEPVPAPVVAEVETPEPRWQEPLAKPARDVSPPPPTPKPVSRSARVSVTELSAAPAPEPEPEPEPDPAPSTAASATTEPVLSLRFASDGDFLRLVAKGEIRVYAYRKAEYLQLDGSYRFHESPAPGKVYELMQETIPALILNALDGAASTTSSFTWAIALPTRIERQILGHLDRVKSGQLVIDRYGDVKHVAST